MTDEDLVLLFGSTLRFAAEYPSAIEQLRVLCQHPDSTFAVSLETLLYAFYHCGVYVAVGLEDKCDAHYKAWLKLGTQEFVKQYVQPLCTMLTKYDSWALTTMVACLIDRCSKCLQHDKLARCRMNGCLCAMFACKPRQQMSKTYRAKALAIYKQLSTQTQQVYIVFETPLKDMPTAKSHPKRKQQTQLSPNPKRYLDYSTEEE